jgi:hypothetical protein
VAPEQSEAEKKLQEARDNMMGVDGMVNLDDFEVSTRAERLVVSDSWAHEKTPE